MASKKAASPKPPKAPRVDAETRKGLEEQVLASLQANQTVDTLANAPEGAQAGLFDGGSFKEIVKKVIPGLLEGYMIVQGGPLTAEKTRQLIELAVRTIQDLIALRGAPDAA